MDLEKQDLDTQFKKLIMQNSDVIFYKKNGYFLFKEFFKVNDVSNIKEQTQKIFINQMFDKGTITSKDITEDEFETAIVALFNSHFETFANCGKQAQHLINLHRLSLDEKLIQK